MESFEEWSARQEREQQAAEGKPLDEQAKAEQYQREVERRQQAAETTSLEALAGQEGEEAEISPEALVGSARQPIPAWKLSLYSALLGLVVMLLLFVFPGFRSVPMPGGGLLATPWFLLIVPVIAILWGVYGVLREEYLVDKAKSLGGIGVAVITCILAPIAVYTDPAREAAMQAEQQQNERLEMTPEQLRAWREEKLRQMMGGGGQQPAAQPETQGQQPADGQ